MMTSKKQGQEHTSIPTVLSTHYFLPPSVKCLKMPFQEKNKAAIHTSSSNSVSY